MSMPETVAVKYRLCVPWKASNEKRLRHVASKTKTDNRYTVHEMSIADLNELDDEEYSEDDIHRLRLLF